jgi:hypothetical protein
MVRALVAFVLIALSSLATASEGAKPEDDLTPLIPDDLVHALKPVSDEDNALQPWREAASRTVHAAEGPLNDVVKKLCVAGPAVVDAQEIKLILEWADANRSALELLSKGCERKSCRVPEESPPIFKSLRTLAKVQLCRAKIRVAEGDFSGASKDVLQIKRMSDLLFASDGDSLQYLISSAIFSHACDGIRVIASGKNPPEAVLTRLQESLQSQPDAHHLVSSLKADVDRFVVQPARRAGKYRGAEQLCRFITAGEPSQNELVRAEAMLAVAPRSFDCTETIKAGIQYGQRIIALGQQPWPLRNKDLLNELKAVQVSSELLANVTYFFQAGAAQLSEDSAKTMRHTNSSEEDKRKMFLSLTSKLTNDERDSFEKALNSEPNAYGNSRISSIFSSYGMLYEKFHLLRAEYDATLAITAIHLFERQRAVLPQDLDVLKKEGLLKTIPIDPFTGNPLRFTPSKGIIWSTGPDAVDDGGDLIKDLVWRF